MITVFYSSIDGYREKRSFKTLAGARKYAQHRVGKSPEIGSYYAVSGDGVGKVTVDGVPFTHLFGDDEDAEFNIYVVHPLGKYFLTREEAEAEVKAAREYDWQEVYGPYEIEVQTATKKDLGG